MADSEAKKPKGGEQQKMEYTGKIAFVVGHSNWGKSSTLRALTNDEFRVRWHTISKVDFFIRRMSNDDQTQGYIDFMTKITPAKYQSLIAALCPKIDDAKNPTEKILKNLDSKGFRLFFWVLETEQGKGNGFISKDEIAMLHRYGTVIIHLGKSTPKQNASVFSKFISERVLT